MMKQKINQLQEKLTFRSNPAKVVKLQIYDDYKLFSKEPKVGTKYIINKSSFLNFLKNIKSKK